MSESEHKKFESPGKSNENMSSGTESERESLCRELAGLRCFEDVYKSDFVSLSSKIGEQRSEIILSSDQKVDQNLDQKIDQKIDEKLVQKIDQSKSKTYSKGADSFSIDCDSEGRVIRVCQNLGGRQELLEPGDAFDNARITQDGCLLLLKDGKIQEARSLEGAHREFSYDRDGNLERVRDRIHTNSGRDLVEVTTRIGSSNIWDYTSNFGAHGQRTNLVCDDNGNYNAELIRNSHPNDLIDKDNSDALHKELAVARQHLIDLAREKNLGNFALNWTKKFEQRCRDQAHRGIASATDEQISRTYGYLEKILSERTRINQGQAKLLFQSALKGYAEPGKYINQGGHPSCAFAMTERHIVQTNPDQHARVLYEAVSRQQVNSRDGRRRIKLADIQIKPDSESIRASKNGNTQVGEWSYSNKIFQLTAISVGYGGYRGNGYDIYGGTDDQCKRANRFISGEKNMVILQNGNLSTFEKVHAHLKRHGTIGLFDYIGGHAMAITDAKISNGKRYIYIDNWWNGTSEGWKRV